MKGNSRKIGKGEVRMLYFLGKIIRKYVLSKVIYC